MNIVDDFNSDWIEHDDNDDRSNIINCCLCAEPMVGQRRPMLCTHDDEGFEACISCVVCDTCVQDLTHCVGCSLPIKKKVGALERVHQIASLRARCGQCDAKNLGLGSLGLGEWQSHRNNACPKRLDKCPDCTSVLKANEIHDCVVTCKWPGCGADVKRGEQEIHDKENLAIHLHKLSRLPMVETTGVCSVHCVCEPMSFVIGPMSSSGCSECEEAKRECDFWRQEASRMEQEIELLKAELQDLQPASKGDIKSSCNPRFVNEAVRVHPLGGLKADVSPLYADIKGQVEMVVPRSSQAESFRVDNRVGRM